eukprot:1876878-Pyramimonas_sp.AAC.2
MEVTLAHVKSGCLLLGLIMAANSIGFGAQVPADIPALKKGPDGSVDDRILARTRGRNRRRLRLPARPPQLFLHLMLGVPGCLRRDSPGTLGVTWSPWGPPEHSCSPRLPASIWRSRRLGPPPLDWTCGGLPRATSGLGPGRARPTPGKLRCGAWTRGGSQSSPEGPGGFPGAIPGFDLEAVASRGPRGAPGGGGGLLGCTRRPVGRGRQDGRRGYACCDALRPRTVRLETLENLTEPKCCSRGALAGLPWSSRRGPLRNGQDPLGATSVRHGFDAVQSEMPGAQADDL